MGSRGFQRLSSFTYVLFIFIVVIALLNRQRCNAMIVLEQWKDSTRDRHQDDGDGDDSSAAVRRKCNLFEGRWVYDETYPLYRASSCAFIEQEFDCKKNGRPDSFYQKYRWQPNACALPRYKGQDLLRELKGKKILFVGDSLSLNQWQSLICMMHVAAPHSQYTLHRVGGVSTFTLPEHEIRVVLSRNAYLVDIVKEKIGTVLKLDSIQNGDSWKGYDVIIFNTWHWWLHKGHQQPGEEWNGTSSGTCRGQSRPMGGSRYRTGPPEAAVVVKQVLSQMAKPVSLLDITTLSQLRRDGHPSVYGIYGQRGNDCSHWCLPGVPDTWNELLFAMLALQGDPTD
ncbi:protein trichome birefringence-like 41 isoform X2 [Prosopis cineraria]|uniref:protein trichome birefringence-like 41 isoform X2 n=1 Tax=Prosopis cineraria TaxID=364024 RepID=UPI00240FBF6E|nr:protein trichome birefringence-like 41 isoform X2 [Prosopis cineraria]